MRGADACGVTNAEDWAHTQRRPPRTRLAMHQDSSQLRACLDPVRGIRDLQLRCAPTPRAGLPEPGWLREAPHCLCSPAHLHLSALLYHHNPPPAPRPHSPDKFYHTGKLTNAAHTLGKGLRRSTTRKPTRRPYGGRAPRTASARPLRQRRRRHRARAPRPLACAAAATPARPTLPGMSPAVVCQILFVKLTPLPLCQPHLCSGGSSSSHYKLRTSAALCHNKQPA